MLFTHFPCLARISRQKKSRDRYIPVTEIRMSLPAAWIRRRFQIQSRMDYYPFWEYERRHLWFLKQNELHEWTRKHLQYFSVVNYRSFVSSYKCADVHVNVQEKKLQTSFASHPFIQSTFLNNTNNAESALSPSLPILLLGLIPPPPHSISP